MGYDALGAAFRSPQPGFDPRATPVTPPGVAFDSAPYTTPRLNVTWRGHLIGLLERLLVPNAWEGTELEIEAAIQETQRLIAGLSQDGCEVMTYPNQAFLFHVASRPGNGSAYETTIIPNTWDGYQALQQPFDHMHYSTNGAQGDWFYQSFYLAAGTYDFAVLGIVESSAGIVTWELDGAGIGTMDWYETYPIANVWQTITGVVVPEGGLHTLRGSMNTNNPASSGYYQTYTCFVFREQAAP
ncbi:MAG: hypothetical protein J0M33_23955 [Anaerolineae bacterium]|nr:hypothetical protein [Anaerolineae bacterium]